MSMLKCLLLVIFICVNGVENGKCPESAVLSPCVCVDENISCGGDNSFNLRQVFQNISDHLAAGDKHFLRFHFNNNGITELVEDVFRDITFEEIIIENAMNLTKIHSHAFITTNLYTKFLFVYKTPLVSISPNYSVYTAINSMVNIEKIELRYTDLVPLPANAFKNFGIQPQLKSLQLHDSQIKTVEPNAFYDLDNLNELLLNFNQIDFISENAFAFRNKANTTLEIYLTGNMLNASKSFTNGSFANINRPAVIYFNDNKQLTYLDQHVFESVLSAGNSVGLSGIKLVCDCKLSWVYKQRTQYVKQVLDATCSDGKPLFTENRAEFNSC